jgi:ankyrin repeat protein
LLHQVYSFKGKLIVVLIEAGAFVKVQSEDLNRGDSPLHLAVSACREYIVKALIKAGADVNAVSLSNGQTALYGAINARSKANKIMTLLCESGADVNHIDEVGYTPLFHLLRWHSDTSRLNTLKLHIKYGADIQYYSVRTGNAMWLAKWANNESCFRYF